MIYQITASKSTPCRSAEWSRQAVHHYTWP